MDRERWQQIDLIFDAALAQPASERAAFLDQACAGDAELRAQVESLIAHERADDFLQNPAFTDAARVLAQDRHSLIGQTIGSYEILETLGAGGMGEVYLALHFRTNRKVTLKVLPATFLTGQPRVQRFQQEARTVLALNHPNIVTVYDIEQAGDTHLIATEVIEGETLRQRLGRARLKINGGARRRDSSSGRTRGRAWHRRHSPRHQAREHHVAARWLCESSGLWFGEADRASGFDGIFRATDTRTDQDGRRHGDGDGELHVAGAGPRPGSGCPHGYLQLRCRALRDADGKPAVRRRDEE